MDSKLSRIEKAILLGAFKLHETLRKLGPYEQDVRQFCTWHQHVTFLEIGYLPVDGPDWAGFGSVCTPAERQQISRAYASLEARKLIFRVNEGGKTTEIL